eukprot:scaffold2502_cov162-Pinguiococcus_pyrenoidosus.AAC.1
MGTSLCVYFGITMRPLVQTTGLDTQSAETRSRRTAAGSEAGAARATLKRLDFITSPRTEMDRETWRLAAPRRGEAASTCC